MTDAATLDRTKLPHLIVKASGEATREVPLLDEVTIGRAEDNSLKLLDPKVSRHHACISRQGDRFVVADLGSANGTLVGGVRLIAPHALAHGESIQIGDAELIYHEPGQSSATTLVTPTPGAVARAGSVPLLPETSRHEGRGPVIGLILAGAVLVGAVLLIGAYWLLPGLFGRGEATATQAGAAGALTATAPLPGAATPVPALGTPLATEQPTAAPNAIPEDELNDQLDTARVFTLQSEIEDAIAIYEKVAPRAPADPRPEIDWAWALIYDDQPDQALAHAQKAVAIAAGDVRAAVVLARAYVDLGRKAEAVAEAERALKLQTNSSAAHAVFAEALRLNERYPEAVDQADLALVQDINNAEAHRARAWLYDLVDGDMGRATGELHIAAGLQTELWVRRHELGEMLLHAGNYTTAIIAFQDALALRPKAVSYSRIGEAYYALGQYDPARISLLEAVQAGARDARTYALLANSDARLGRCDHARAYVNDALTLEPANDLALEAQAICQASGSPPTPIATSIAAVTPTPGPTPRPTRIALAAALSGRVAFPVYNAGTGMYDVYVARIDGSRRKLVLDGFDQPAFSPDGEWLAVRGNKADQRNVFVVRADGTGIKKVTENVEDKLPYWSPDGGRLVFASTKDQPGHPKAVYVIDPLLIEGQKMVDSRRIETGRGPVQGEHPSWMPDGRLVYQGCDYWVSPMSCGIFIIDPGGGQFIQLTKNEQDAAPAGFGGRVVFMSNRDGNWEIYIVREDGTHLKRLTKNASDDGLPIWSPDGKSIFFMSNQGGAWAVWAMNPDGSALQKLFDIGGGLDASWTDQRISWAP